MVSAEINNMQSKSEQKPQHSSSQQSQDADDPSLKQVIYEGQIYRIVQYKVLPDYFVKLCHAKITKEKIKLDSISSPGEEAKGKMDKDMKDKDGKDKDSKEKERPLKDLHKFNLSEISKKKFILKPHKDQLMKFLSRQQFQHIELFYFVLDTRANAYGFQESLLLGSQDEKEMENWRFQLKQVLESNNQKAMQQQQQRPQSQIGQALGISQGSSKSIKDKKEDQSKGGKDVFDKSSQQDNDQDEEEFLECLEQQTPKDNTQRNKFLLSHWDPYTYYEGVSVYKDRDNQYMTSINIRSSPKQIFEDVLKMISSRGLYMHKRIDKNAQILKGQTEIMWPVSLFVRPTAFYARMVWRKESDGTYVINLQFYFDQEIAAESEQDDGKNQKKNKESNWSESQELQKKAGLFQTLASFGFLPNVDSIAITISPLKDEMLGQYGFSPQQIGNPKFVDKSPESLLTIVAQMNKTPASIYRLFVDLELQQHVKFVKTLMKATFFVKDKLELQRFVAQPFSQFEGAQANQEENSRGSYMPSMNATIRMQEKRKQADSSSDQKPISEIKEPVVFTPVKYFSCPGAANFKVRGPNYLKDKAKIQAPDPIFRTVGLELLEVPEPTKHIARFLPCVRRSQAPFTLVVNFMVPRVPPTSFVAIFAYEQNLSTLDDKKNSKNSKNTHKEQEPKEKRGNQNKSPTPNLQNIDEKEDEAHSGNHKATQGDLSPKKNHLEKSHDSEQNMKDNGNGENLNRTSSDSNQASQNSDQDEFSPFEISLSKFLAGTDKDRNQLLKLIPSVVEGSWFIKQSVGSTPVIMGTKLETTYIQGPRYLEVDVNVGSNSVANNVTQMVAGVLTGLKIDLAFLLEGKTPEELPESLLGTLRINNMDFKDAVQLDTSQEIEALHMD